MTGDHGLLQIQLSVQYSISDPAKYLFVVGPDLAEQLVTRAVQAGVSTNIAHHTVDDLLRDPALKGIVCVEARQDAQRLLDEHYGAGVSLVRQGVQIVDMRAPGAVMDAFNDVLAAQSEANTMVRQAESEAQQTRQGAVARKVKILAEAHAYAGRLVELADAEAEDFPRRAAAFRKAPDVTARRLFLETMEVVLPRVKKALVGTDAQRTDLTIVEPGS